MSQKRSDRAINFYAVHDQTENISIKEENKRKERVLTQGTPSVTRSIADAVVMKMGNLFYLSKPDGNVPCTTGHGYGLYYHDCRFLNGYELRMADAEPSLLVSSAVQGHTAVYELTNPEIVVSEGEHIPHDTLGMTLQRKLSDENLTVYDLYTFTNYSMEAVTLPVTFRFRADFEDVFAIRGLLPTQLGKLHPPEWREDGLYFLYEGKDGLYRSTWIHFSLPPDQLDRTTGQLTIDLGPRESLDLLVQIQVQEAPEEAAAPGRQTSLGLDTARKLFTSTQDEWDGGWTEIRSNSLLLNQIMNRSLRDMQMLRTTINDQGFFAAGVPWFVTLFGRDAILTAMQMLAYDPEIAAETLRLLAGFQGEKVDDYRDEQPGKILHELRVGELARLNEIPHTPYYGTIDATPLFIDLIARHYAWSGDLSLFNELRPHVDRALKWIDDYGDIDGDGYVEYESLQGRGLVNQGWKDSGDAIVTGDGHLATPPVALVEVQGYVYDAKRRIAVLFEHAGERERAEALRREAAELRRRFNRDFWMEDLGIYTLGLHTKSKEPLRVISSNPGHALWSRIASADKAQKTAERLMQPDMFNGWGIRTLSNREILYNPIGYHLGTVWPHDNAIIAAGFRRYGLDQAALQVFDGLVQSAIHFDIFRLPELFAGFRRDKYNVPVHYPVANHPQAWAAGSIPYLVQVFLGLAPEACDRRLRVVRPILPDFVDWLEVRGLRVGDASADLKFFRMPDGHAGMHVIHVDGDLDIVVSGEPRHE